MGPIRFRYFSFRAVAREACDALAALLFAAPCRICGDVLETASRIPVCPQCLDALRPLLPPFCQCCGRPAVSVLAAQAQRLLCTLCRRGVYAFDLARSYGAYDEAMIHAVVLLKYHAVRPLADWFSGRLADVVAREPAPLAADVVVPVPLHRTRLRERGYNQAELIARPLARRLGLPLRSFLLVRTRPRPNKLKLTRQERWRTVRGAYALREGAQVDKLRVMLVDDVFTTGATLDACARALRRAGASKVVGLTVARAVPGWARSRPATQAQSPTR